MDKYEQAKEIIERWYTDIEALRAWQRRAVPYTEHTDTCQSHVLNTSTGKIGECDCGLRAIIEEADDA